MICSQARIFAALLAVALAAAPVVAYAQVVAPEATAPQSTAPQPPPPQLPSYAQPSTVPGEDTVQGRITSFDGAYSMQVRDDRGFTANIQLRQGTIINPTGIRLVPGMAVTIHGVNHGPVLLANQIDTPYQSYGYAYPAYPYAGYGYGYGYGPYWPVSIGIGFGFGFGPYWGRGYCCGGYWGRGRWH